MLQFGNGAVDFTDGEYDPPQDTNLLTYEWKIAGDQSYSVSTRRLDSLVVSKVLKPEEWISIGSSTAELTVKAKNGEILARFEVPIKQVDFYTDLRDGRVYDIMTFAGRTVMIQNLNYNSDKNSWCYDNVPENCDQFGRIYSQEESKTVCPEGWTVFPDKRLYERSGGLFAWDIRSPKAWPRNIPIHNGYGLSYLPTGVRLKDGSFQGLGLRSAYWFADTARVWDVQFQDKYYFPSDFGRTTKNVSDFSGAYVRCQREE